MTVNFFIFIFPEKAYNMPQNIFKKYNHIVFPFIIGCGFHRFRLQTNLPANSPIETKQWVITTIQQNSYSDLILSASAILLEAKNACHVPSFTLGKTLQLSQSDANR